MIKEIDEEDHRMVGSAIMKYKRLIYIYIYKCIHDEINPITF